MQIPERSSLEKVFRTSSLTISSLESFSHLSSDISLSNPGKDHLEMILQSVDGLLDHIMLMNMWWDKLEAAVVGCDGMLKFSANFIVKDVHCWGRMPSC